MSTSWSRSWLKTAAHNALTSHHPSGGTRANPALATAWNRTELVGSAIRGTSSDNHHRFNTLLLPARCCRYPRPAAAAAAKSLGLSPAWWRACALQSHNHRGRINNLPWLVHISSPFLPISPHFSPFQLYNLIEVSWPKWAVDDHSWYSTDNMKSAFSTAPPCCETKPIWHNFNTVEVSSTM